MQINMWHLSFRTHKRERATIDQMACLCNLVYNTTYLKRKILVGSKIYLKVFSERKNTNLFLHY